MNVHEWNEALGHLDTELVEEYYKTKERIEKKQKARAAFARFGTLAACLALACAAVLVLPRFKQAESTDTDTSLETERVLPPIPVYQNAIYSAEDAARAFSGRYYASSSTQFYSPVPVSDGKYLDVGRIPDAEHLEIYTLKEATVEIDELEFTDFLSGMIARYAEIADCEIPAVEFVERNYNGPSLETVLRFGDERLMVNQWTNCYKAEIDAFPVKTSRTLLNQSIPILEKEMSDGEVTDALAAMRDAAFELFGVSFTEVRVTRSFNYRDTNVGYTVIYCNKQDTDNIRIHINSDQTKNVSVVYTAYRGEDVYTAVGESKMISLEDAEALLYNGYVFGGHICGACALKQEEVSFYGYDYAGFEYLYSYGAPTEEKIGFPFYAFYKKIRVEECGIEVYAKTYVPAIELSGYEEYFEKQEAAHSVTDGE